MPCYEEQTYQTDFNGADKALVKEAEALTLKEQRGRSLAVSGGKITADSVQTANAFRRNYSRLALKKAAKQTGWNITTKTSRKLNMTRG